MPLTAQWLGRNDVERIAEMRMRCYGGPADRERFLRRTINDRFEDGDVLMLTQDGVDVATATSMRLNINIRGTILPCQGVAWVGTARTHRRRRIDGHGLATHVLNGLRQKALERGEPVSMLAPFRVSFYEHFGFGVVERQATWNIPLGLLPHGETGGFAEMPAGSSGEAEVASRHRQFLATHGDVDTNAKSLKFWLNELKDVGYRIIDRDASGAVRSQFTLGSEVVDGQHIAVVHRPWWDSPAALRDLLAMLGSLKDQYSSVRITLPADLQINWLLKERQVPHRRVEHAAATCAINTRMQAAIIGLTRFCSALRPPAGVTGECRIAIKSHEAEQVWKLQFDGGRVTGEPASGEADVEMDDVALAAISFGDLSASEAAAFGLIKVHQPAALGLLESLSAGQKPYCHEYF